MSKQKEYVPQYCTLYGWDEHTPLSWVVSEKHDMAYGSFHKRTGRARDKSNPYGDKTDKVQYFKTYDQAVRGKVAWLRYLIERATAAIEELKVSTEEADCREYEFLSLLFDENNEKEVDD